MRVLEFPGGSAGSESGIVTAWHAFSPWPRNFHMPWAWPKKKKKKEKQKTKERENRDTKGPQRKFKFDYYKITLR